MMKKKLINIVILFISLSCICGMCSKEDVNQAPAAVPTLITTAATGITSTTAITGGNVTSDGGAPVTDRGVCWSTTTNPTIANSKTTDGTGTGVFTSSLTGLTANATYYAKAYATNSAGTAYGNEISFTTQPIAVIPTLPTVITTAATGITTTTATSGGNVTSEGGTAVTARGVCWSTTSNPTIANSKTNDGAGIGSFTSLITSSNFNTSYYVRAYATNSAGTAYGNEVSFKTTNLKVAENNIIITSAVNFSNNVPKTFTLVNEDGSAATGINYSVVTTSNNTNSFTSITQVPGTTSFSVTLTTNSPTPNTSFDINYKGIKVQTINATIPVNQPASLTMVSGNNQVGEITQLLANPFKVLVKDQSGVKMERVSVTWIYTNVSGNIFNTGTTSTDSNGETSIQFNSDAEGTIRATASVKRADGSHVSGSPVIFEARFNDSDRIYKEYLRGTTWSLAPCEKADQFGKCIVSSPPQYSITLTGNSNINGLIANVTDLSTGKTGPADWHSSKSAGKVGAIFNCNLFAVGIRMIVGKNYYFEGNTGPAYPFQWYR